MNRQWIVLLVIGLATVATPLMAQDSSWGWDRTAGANMEGAFGYLGDAGSSFGNAGISPRYRDYGDADSGAATPYTAGYGSYSSPGYAGSYGGYSQYGQVYDPRASYGQYGGQFQQWQPGVGGQQMSQPGFTQGQFSSMESFGQAPVRVGERVQPAGSGAQLMVGQQVVGFVPQGEVLPVWDVQGPWVGTRADLNGREVRGWVHISQLAPVSVATTRTR